MKGKKVLVTGAGGFIGSHLCERLLRLGAEVTALVRYNSRGSYGYLESLPSDLSKDFNIVFGDIRDERTFGNNLADKDVIFNLAAIPGIPYSFIYPEDIFEVNTKGPLNLLNAARDMQHPPKIILISSAETYGDFKYLPIDEKHPQFPKSPYAACKAAMEQLAWSFIFAYELPVNMVRLFNNYGPRQSARAVTPTIISQLVQGNELRIGSLSPKRDFTFVLDTVEALIKVAELDDFGEVYNIGSNCTISIEEIVNIVANIMQKNDLKIITEKARIRPGNSEVPALRGDYTKLNERTGWKPAYGYPDGLKLTIDWISEHIKLYKTGTYSI